MKECQIYPGGEEGGLIEAYWNVNEEKEEYSNFDWSGLIEAYWNVNAGVQGTLGVQR